MRRYLPVQVVGVLLAVGTLTSVSTPFGIGDVIVRTPIVLSNAAAGVIRAVTDSATKVSAMHTVPPSRSIPRADADSAVSRTDVAQPGRLGAGRSPETVRMTRLSMRLAPAGVTAAAGVTRVVARNRLKEVRQYRREIEQRNRHRISPVRAPRRPHRAPFIRPLHRS